jgi:hypothetical protein
MLSSIYFDRIKNGLTYKQNLDNTIFEINSDQKEITDLEKLNFIKLNIQRSTRIDKTYVPSEVIEDILSKNTLEQTWLVLTENWCGDSAQNLPYIAKFAEANVNIQLVILERDKNLDIMNHYLTSGTLSIPKLIAFDDKWNELFQWGPRPAEAVALISKLKNEGKVKDEFMKELHLWYSRNKGKAIEKEFVEILKKISH